MYKITEISEIPLSNQNKPSKYFELLKIVEGKVNGFRYECDTKEEAIKLRNSLVSCVKKYNLKVFLRQTFVYVMK